MKSDGGQSGNRNELCGNRGLSMAVDGTVAENVSKKDRAFGFRRLIGLAQPHWRSLGVATAALVLGSGIALLYPQAARLVVDEVFVEGSTWNLSTVGFALLGLFLLQSVFVSVRFYLFTVVGDRVVADLRQRLF